MKTYPTDPMVDQLFKNLLGRNFTIEDSTEFFLFIRTGEMQIKAWNANKDYAWLSYGEMKCVREGRCIYEYSWDRQMPSRRTARKFKKKCRIVLAKKMKNLF